MGLTRQEVTLLPLSAARQAQGQMLRTSQMAAGTHTPKIPHSEMNRRCGPNHRVTSDPATFTTIAGRIGTSRVRRVTYSKTSSTRQQGHVLPNLSHTRTSHPQVDTVLDQVTLLTLRGAR